AARAAVPGALCLFLAGCAVGPNYKRPMVPVPDRFYGDERAAEARSLADVPWWDVFDDPILKGLIEEAVRNGFDARLSAARVQEARARYGIVRSQFFPSVDYGGGWQRGRANQLLNPSGQTQTAWSVDVGFSWELDLWGALPAAQRSGPRPVPRDGGGAPRRPPFPGVGRGRGLHGPARAGFRARDREDHDRRLPGHLRPVQPPPGGRSGLRPGDGTGRGLAGAGRGADPRDR